jgi:hypothetical protein
MVAGAVSKVTEDIPNEQNSPRHPKARAFFCFHVSVRGWHRPYFLLCRGLIGSDAGSDTVDSGVRVGLPNR